MGPLRCSSVLILLSAAILLSSTATAHNITLILKRYPDFSQFNSLLTQTKLADIINRRRTITVLALTNSRVGDLSGKPDDVLKRILSTHVVLDYYDELKLNKLKPEKTILTTLYQSTGTADDQQGFLDVIHKRDGTIVFGSAMKGAPIDAQLEGSVASQPYNISVLSVSHPIIAPGIDGTWHPVAAPPPRAAAPPPAVPSPAESPEEQVDDASSPAEAPEPSAAPADSPVADAPADAPAADAPAADAPTADAPSADADARSGSGKRAASSVSLGFIVALVSFVAAN